jgi:DNA-binding NarL/FixJ family response regulator
MANRARSEHPEAGAGEKSSPRKGHHILKVLIAEDSLLVSDRLKELLSELDQVEIIGPAPDGDTALQLFHDHSPEVALLDLQMPGRSGVKALIEIRKLRRSCVVIVLTNYDYPEFRAACLRAGADFFLSKSTEFERAIEIVREMTRPCAEQVSIVLGGNP